MYKKKKQYWANKFLEMFLCQKQQKSVVSTLSTAKEIYQGLLHYYKIFCSEEL